MIEKRHQWYVLPEDHQPIPVDMERYLASVRHRIESLATGNDPWRVALTKIGDVKISTVFLGLNHQFSDGPPILFETMVLGGEHDQYRQRCSTWAEAEAMHARAVERVKGQ